MFTRLTFPTILLLAGLTSVTASLAEDSNEPTYPAPPGIYGQPELLEEIGLLDNDLPSQTEASPPAFEAPVAKQKLPESTEKLPPPLLRAPPQAPVAMPSPIQAPIQTSKKAPTQAPMSTSATQYPDARQLMQRMNQAGQWAFDQWGVPLQPPAQPLYRSPTDYGYAEVPIVERAPYPTRRGSAHRLNPATAGLPQPGTAYANPWMENTLPVPGSNVSRDRPAYSADYGTEMIPGMMPGSMSNAMPNAMQVPSTPVPGADYMSQYPANYPSGYPSTYTGQYGVPLPGQSFNNSQFMYRVPEEDIIYPPSWPGRR